MMTAAGWLIYADQRKEIFDEDQTASDFTGHAHLSSRPLVLFSSQGPGCTPRTVIPGAGLEMAVNESGIVFRPD